MQKREMERNSHAVHASADSPLNLICEGQIKHEAPTALRSGLATSEHSVQDGGDRWAIWTDSVLWKRRKDSRKLRSMRSSSDACDVQHSGSSVWQRIGSHLTLGTWNPTCRPPTRGSATTHAACHARLKRARTRAVITPPFPCDLPLVTW